MRVVVVAVLALGVSQAGCESTPTYNLDGGDLVTVGHRYVDQRDCAMCHQSDKAADGTLSGQSTPRPGTMAYAANLTPDIDTGIGSWADIEIVRAMRFGIDNEQQPLCPPMPHFDGSDPAVPFMTDLEAMAIVAYLRSLPAVTRNDIPESMCPPLKPAPPADMAVDSAVPDGSMDASAPDGAMDIADGGAGDAMHTAPTDGGAAHD